MPGTHEDHREQSEIDRQRRERLKREPSLAVQAMKERETHDETPPPEIRERSEAARLESLKVPPPRDEGALAFHEELGGKPGKGYPPPPDAEDGEAVFGKMVEGDRHAAPMLREGALDRAEGSTCSCVPGGKLCATCARGETDPGMVPFEELPEETKKKLKPGQCIIWNAKRGCYVPVPAHVQAAVGGDPLTPLKSPWAGYERVQVSSGPTFSGDSKALVPELQPEDRLHTATAGEEDLRSVDAKEEAEDLRDEADERVDAEIQEILRRLERLELEHPMMVAEGRRSREIAEDEQGGDELTKDGYNKVLEGYSTDELKSEIAKRAGEEIVSKEETALQVRRDLQERAFLVLLGDEHGKKWPEPVRQRREYFCALWILAAEAVEARP